MNGTTHHLPNIQTQKDNYAISAGSSRKLQALYGYYSAVLEHDC